MLKKGKIKINEEEIIYDIKYFDFPSEYGIDEGRISKLSMKKNGKIIANYDRGWDIKPKCKEGKQALTILNKYNSYNF